MNKHTHAMMKKAIDKYLDFTSPMRVADLGSLDINGSDRILIPSSCEYVGLDIVAGKNVDVVMPGEYEIPFPDNYFDALISNQCFEHVRNPFKLMAEVKRVVKLGGYVLIVAPIMLAEHRSPPILLDCWRFLRDGWKVLFDENGIEFVDVEHWDCGRRELQAWVAGVVGE